MPAYVNRQTLTVAGKKMPATEATRATSRKFDYVVVVAGRKREKSETLATSLALARSLLKRTQIGAYAFLLWPRITVSDRESNLLLTNIDI